MSRSLQRFYCKGGGPRGGLNLEPTLVIDNKLQDRELTQNEAFPVEVLEARCSCENAH